jgi:hypothetical protein
MEIANFFYVDEAIILNEIIQLTDLLEQYRDLQVEAQQAQYKVSKVQSPLLPASEKAAIEFLGQPNLMQKMDKLLQQAGIQHDSQRLFLYVVGASYKNKNPLHIGIRGNANSAKNLINSIGQCLPPQDTMLLNQISSKSFYHCTDGQLMNKVMLLPHGVDRKTLPALNLLQQGETLTTATSSKDKLGNIVAAFKQVHSHFSSIMYVRSAEENEGNVIMAILNNSSDQAIEYTNNKVAGRINEQEEIKAKQLLQNIVRCLKPAEVVNPHAGKINLPVHEDIKLQTTLQYQSLVNKVCLLHQCQRKRDSQNRLIAEIEDMRIAAELLFGSIIIEGEELEPDLRKFYERVKAYVKRKEVDNKEAYGFTMREIRQQLKISKTSCFRFMGELQELEYVKRTGYANRGFKYEVVFYDEERSERDKLIADLNTQFEKLGAAKTNLVFGTPEHQFGTPGTHTSLDTKGISSGVPRSLENLTRAPIFLNDDGRTYKTQPKKHKPKK